MGPAEILMSAMLSGPPGFRREPTCAVMAEAPKRKAWPWRIAVSLNQTLNAIFGGDPDETLSSRWGRTRDRNWIARQACKGLDKIDPCHCTEAIEFDAEGNPLPHQLWKR